jgi:hypothetical protein
VIRAGRRQRRRPPAAPAAAGPTTGALAAAALALVLPLAGCGGGQPEGSGPSAPAASASPLVRAIGQSCTWQHGLTVTVDAVHRSGPAGYTVALHLVNKTVMSYATDGLTVELLVGTGKRAVDAAPSAARGAGLAGRVVAPGASTSASYGYALTAPPAGSQVSVLLQPSPVDQPCLLRGTAG